MKVLYFAWVRERIGKAEETVEPPASVRTVSDLMEWLVARGEVVLVEDKLGVTMTEIIKADKA